MERRIKYGDDKSIKLWHLFYYFPRDKDWDNHAQLLLDFKSNSMPAAGYLLECALRELKAYKLKQEIVVVRALKSWELKAGSEQNKTLGFLCQGIACGINGIYVPHLLRKRRKTKPLKDMSALEREKEIAKVYELRDIGFDLANRQILLVDDIVTTGATSRVIVGEILKHYPSAKVNVFALAWTPARNQRRLLAEQRETNGFAEPEAAYGGRRPPVWDGEYENQQTFIKI